MLNKFGVQKLARRGDLFAHAGSEQSLTETKPLSSQRWCVADGLAAGLFWWFGSLAIGGQETRKGPKGKK
jgi:hypothetical protein